MTGLWNQIVISAATISSGPAFWGLIQWLRNRRGDKALAAREQQAQEKAKVKAEIDKADLLAEAQRTAQQTALDSANSVIERVEKDCQNCRDELHGLRDIMGKLIDAIEALMDEDTATTRADARATIRLARRAM